MGLAFNLSLFPPDSEVSSQGHLVIGGCDLMSLAEEYGTPLYIFDEKALREKCREFKSVFDEFYPGTKVVYASKAFINKPLAVLFKEEGMGLDVVSGGEISIAHSAGFPLDRVYFHGNNKGLEELKLALQLGAGRIVVDNFHELGLLDKLAGDMGIRQTILLRITPGIDPHTQQKISTGNVDSKFGFPESSREQAVVQALASPNLDLAGFHSHIGSLIFDTQPYLEALKVVLGFAAEMKKKHGLEFKELNVGGGFAIQYVSESPAPPPRFYAESLAAAIKRECAGLNMSLPNLTIEPGRSVVGKAGVALYTVGAIKDIPGIRRYVSVDGGMADNIRPAIYGSKYEAVVANKALAPNEATVTIAGKFCESGDILINDIQLPAISSGDLIAVPDCGAYCLAMASNYNASLKPPIVLVKDRQARLIRRRETYEDLSRLDVM
ncbi:MAG: diaminopimelate decarboxylase [Dehalococcoidales bacterium]|nr:diaminopimelate decarboxylase [Dehalococcoidales bacterium]